MLNKLIMKNIFLFIAIIAAMASGMSSCGGNSAEKQAEEWLTRARELSDKGEYTKALAAIDSLRKDFPEAVNARREGLKLYQQTSLKAAQKVVEQADRALQAANNEYAKMQANVAALKAKGAATAEQLTALTLLRMKRDSLRTVFDVECAKIKYIHKKMAE